MSVYKVPQNVEADDKLIGPFNFRQFIYLLVVAGLAAVMFFLWQIFPGLIIIPLPAVIFFAALALPLKKDQPMELYLAAVVGFYLRPNKRIWQADGIEHLIEISAPMKTDERLAKDISRDEASRRLSYLADIVDTEGWAIKHAVSADNTFQQDIITESEGMADIFENHSANRIDQILQNHNQLRKQQIIKNMNTARNAADYAGASTEQINQQIHSTPSSSVDYYADLQQRTQARQNQYLGWNQPAPTPVQPVVNSQPTAPVPTPQQVYDQMDESSIQLKYNPYPDSIHQAKILPLSEQQAIQPPVAPLKETSIKNDPEMMRLVSEGKDLSVETLARQANKIKKRREEEVDLSNEEEVIISLR